MWILNAYSYSNISTNKKIHIYESKEQVSSNIANLFPEGCVQYFLITWFLNLLRPHYLNKFCDDFFSKTRNMFVV